MCCNDDLNLVNYLVQGVGRDFYWPPNVAAGATLEDLIGPPGVRGAGCSAGPGLYGYPPTSDPWSTWLHSYFGGRGGALATSNVVFSNGLLDPWSAAGVYADDAPLQPGPYVGPLARNVSAAADVTALSAALLLAVTSWPFFSLLQHGGIYTVFAVMAGFAIIIGIAQGPTPAMMAELFPTRSRLTGIGIGYNVTQAIAGGTAPAFCTWLVMSTGMNTSPAIYLILSAVVGLIGAVFLTETRGCSLSVDPTATT